MSLTVGEFSFTYHFAEEQSKRSGIVGGESEGCQKFLRLLGSVIRLGNNFQNFASDCIGIGKHVSIIPYPAEDMSRNLKVL